MRHCCLLAAAALAAVFSIGPSVASADAAAIAARLGDEIHAGSVDHSDTDVDWGKAVGVVNAPFDRVMGAVSGYAAYQEFLPHFRQSRVLSQRGTSAMVYLEASVIQDTVTLWANLRIRELAPRGQTRIIEASMTDGNMERFLARWEVAPLDGGQRALVSFQLLVEPSVPMPASVFTRENVKSARKTIRALRRHLGVA